MDYDITYERDIYRSYMKISTVSDGNFDEKILLSQKIDGLLTMEKNYFQGSGQYWYDISGKQALDIYCKTTEIGIELLEQLILQICNQLERFEWSLLRAECLLLQPETIFISVADEKIYFTGYPKESGNIFHEIQVLMEFLLMKISHSDTEAVQNAYELYEIILSGEFHVSDLRNFIIEKRMHKKDSEERIEEVQAVMIEDSQIETVVEKEWETKGRYNLKFQNIMKKVMKIAEQVLPQKEEKIEEISEVVYPDENIADGIQGSIHPTVCLTSMRDAPSGVLMYEGTGEFRDFEIGNTSCVVGKSHRVKLQIDKDTISHFHAKIEWKEDGYYIEDMNSTNGTYVNDEILNFREIKKLHSGDMVRFADVKYRFL